MHVTLPGTCLQLFCALCFWGGVGGVDMAEAALFVFCVRTGLSRIWYHTPPDVSSTYMWINRQEMSA